MSYTFNLYDAAGAYLRDVSLTPGRETARDVLGYYSNEELARRKVPREHAALVPWNAAKRWTRSDILPTVMRVAGYEHVVIIDRRTIQPETVDAGWLAIRLPHIGPSARDRLLRHLVTFAPGHLDLFSIEDRPNQVSADTTSASGMYDQVAIYRLNPTTPQSSIHFEGEELFPYRLLPDGDRIEFRSAYTCLYRAVSEEVRLAHAVRMVPVDHCKKLLDDLPIALKNSESAMEAHAASDEVDLTTLGAMLLEQRRIRKEIVDQQARLPLMEQEVIEATIKDPPMQLYQLQTSLRLPFGLSEVDGRVYRLERRSPMEGAPPPTLSDAASKSKATAAEIELAAAE